MDADFEKAIKAGFRPEELISSEECKRLFGFTPEEYEAHYILDCIEDNKDK